VLDLIDSDRDYFEVYQTQGSSSFSSQPLTGDAARLNEIRNGMDHRAKEAYLKRMLAVAHQWQVRRRQIIPFHRPAATNCLYFSHLAKL
jgi:transposase-like protein